ncbi:uncharacterized protein LOC110657500 [Hevea brasiliensis]|uniref:uncharacterized protein LOC110657500 n=1 Tax=Hevea brasiliensis TaxID=3981 RepID=UPI0025D8C45C|nr:uncharacterized protein LOC110657500 [Hevea brasiliensis]
MPIKVDRCRRFEDGLNDNSRLLITAHQITDFSRLMAAALNVERVWESEHNRRNRLEAASTSQKGASKTTERPKARVAPSAYAIQPREEPNPADVIRGTFSLYDMSVYTLINPGSTHSYICIAPPVDKGVQIEGLEEDILITNPLGHSVMVKKVYKGCPLMIQGYEFSADLIELPFYKFDVILGMDWLSHHQVMVDY